jgi:hypothetical protein
MSVTEYLEGVSNGTCTRCPAAQGRKFLLGEKRKGPRESAGEGDTVLSFEGWAGVLSLSHSPKNHPSLSGTW